MTALRYEWVRLWTVRSTRLITLSILIIGVVAGVLARNVDLSTEEGLRTLVGPLMQFLAIIASVIPAQAIGQEYRFGLIRQTLTLFPRRSTILVAKWWVSSLFAALLVTVALAVAIGAAVLAGAGAPGAAIVAGELAKIVVYLVTYMTVTFAVAALTRQVALGVILPLLLRIAVEGALIELGNVDSRYLPFSSGSAFLAVDGPWLEGLVFAAYGLAFLVAAWALFQRRDA